MGKEPPTLDYRPPHIRRRRTSLWLIIATLLMGAGSVLCGVVIGTVGVFFLWFALDEQQYGFGCIGILIALPALCAIVLGIYISDKSIREIADW